MNNIFSVPVKELTPKHIGYVYIILDKIREIVKIGKSRFPKLRISSITKQSGLSEYDFYVSPKIIGYSKLEEYLHGIFSDKRIAGEWFKCSYHEAIKKLKEICPNPVTLDQEEIAVNNARTKAEHVSDVFSALLLNNNEQTNSDDFLRCILENINEVYLDVESIFHIDKYLCKKYLEFTSTYSLRGQALEYLRMASKLIIEADINYKSAAFSLGSQEKIKELISYLETYQ